MVCNNCGKMMIGDGATEPIRCENAEGWEDREPDCNPIDCESVPVRVHIVDQPCRKCGQIPLEGFFGSRAKRYDWICPRCSNKYRGLMRKNAKLKIEYREGQGHD